MSLAQKKVLAGIVLNEKKNLYAANTQGDADDRKRTAKYYIRTSIFQATLRPEYLDREISAVKKRPKSRDQIDEFRQKYMCDTFFLRLK